MVAVAVMEAAQAAVAARGVALGDMVVVAVAVAAVAVRGVAEAARAAHAALLDAREHF